jgi:hypothetical protein
LEEKMLKLQPLAPITSPSSPWRRRVWVFAESDIFNFGALSLIVLSTLMMATESYDASSDYVNTTDNINWMFTMIFSLEILIRLTAYGHRFFYEAWNNFDLFVVVTAIIEQLVAASIGIKVLRALRISRIFRTIRIVRRLPRLHTLIKALASAFPALISAVALVLIVSFIFTTIGVQFFAGLKYGYLIDKKRNFDNSWTCMTLLFQVATGSGYRLAIGDASVVEPSCTKCKQCRQGSDGTWLDFNDCGNWQGAAAFLGMYLLIVRYILLNLLVAVLVDKFFQFDAQMRFVLQESHLESYQVAWQSVDVHGEATLPISQMRILVDLLHRLKNPLGSSMFADEYKFRITRVELVHKCPHYAILEGAELGFNQTLLTLALHVVGPHALPLDLRLKREQELTMFAQMAVTSRATQLYNQKRLAATLEQDKQSSLQKIVKSLAADDSRNDHSGSNLVFAVFSGRSKVIIDMHREELLHVDEAPIPVILFQMPFASIHGVTNTAGSALVIRFADNVDLRVEIDDLDRVQLVDVLQSFEDINAQRQDQMEESVLGNRKEIQSDLLRFRLVVG